MTQCRVREKHFSMGVVRSTFPGREMTQWGFVKSTFPGGGDAIRNDGDATLFPRVRDDAMGVREKRFSWRW